MGWKIEPLNRKMRSHAYELSQGARAYCHLTGNPLQVTDIDALIADAKQKNAYYYNGVQLKIVFWWDNAGNPSSHTEKELRELLKRELG